MAQEFKNGEVVKIKIQDEFYTEGEILSYNETSQEYRILLHLGCRDIRYFTADKLQHIEN